MSLDLDDDHHKDDTFREEQLAKGAKLVPGPIASIAEVFCGCGCPHLAWKWIHGYLGERKAGDVGYLDEDDGTEWIAVYLMDHLGLTEHGTGIRGAWLTDAGKQVLTFLDEHGPDWAEHGWWIDDKGTTLSTLDQ